MTNPRNYTSPKTLHKLTVVKQMNSCFRI